MDINAHAPVHSRAKVEIAAPVQEVWALMSDIDAWPKWNRSVKSAHLEGPLEAGSRFRWKAGPGTITSTLETVDPLREIGWTGKTLGIFAIHVWRIEGHDGHTTVRTEESWDGLPARFFRSASLKAVDKAVRSGLRDLKTAAEKGEG